MKKIAVATTTTTTTNSRGACATCKWTHHRRNCGSRINQNARRRLHEADCGAAWSPQWIFTLFLQDGQEPQDWTGSFLCWSRQSGEISGQTVGVEFYQTFLSSFNMCVLQEDPIIKERERERERWAPTLERASSSKWRACFLNYITEGASALAR